MGELFNQIAGHNDMSVHIIGWLVTAIVAMCTLLYKGIWAAIKLLRSDLDETREELNRLIGEHRATHKWSGAERRIVEDAEDE